MGLWTGRQPEVPYHPNNGSKRRMNAQMNEKMQSPFDAEMLGCLHHAGHGNLPVDGDDYG